MKKVEAIIRHFKLEEVTNALAELGAQGMTITEVRGFGRQKGHCNSDSPGQHAIDFVPKLKLELVVPDEQVAQVLDTIRSMAQTGQIGDGKIFVSEIVNILRIRTGDTGEQAL